MNVERCFQTNGRSGKLSLLKHIGLEKIGSIQPMEMTRQRAEGTAKAQTRRQKATSRNGMQVSLAELQGEEQRVGT